MFRFPALFLISIIALSSIPKANAFIDLDLSRDTFVTDNTALYIKGRTTSDLTGQALDMIDDFNGDSINDIIVCAPQGNDNANANIGLCWIIFGGSTRATSDLLLSSFTSGTDGLFIIGALAHDKLGISVADAGDINNDGLSDIVVGAYGANEGGGGNSGVTYVILGFNSSSYSDIDMSSFTTSASTGYRIIGSGSNTYCGFSVSGKVDFNGDGAPDVITSEYGAGKVYVIFGHSTSFSYTDITLSTFTSGSTGQIIIGVAADKFGYNVGAAGDINGDTIGDIIIGAPDADPSSRANAGAVYVVFGGNSGDIDVSSWTAGIDGFMISGEEASDNMGWAVSGVGDHNGDGFDDVVIGAQNSYLAKYYNPDRDIAGKVLVLFGKNTAFSDIDGDTFTSGAEGYWIHGAGQLDRMGWSVSDCGDVNQDGLADVCIGGYEANSYSGRAYALFGHSHTSTTFSTVDLSTFTSGSSTGYFAEGSVNYQLGDNVGGGGDFDNDGIDDFLVGAKGFEGAAFVVYGIEATASPTSQPSSQPSSVPSSAPSNPAETILSLRQNLSSATYTMTSGFGFAVQSPAGAVVKWGKFDKTDYPAAGDWSTEATTVLDASAADSGIVQGRTASVALKSTGGLEAWGVPAAYVGAEAYATSPVFTSLVANEAAFAGLDSAGAVYTFGFDGAGGNISQSAYATELSSNVSTIVASAAAFAALKNPPRRWPV
mmetsp:Transcript_4440/g.7299  ORF Transcript_4440/g.7299 Transcript_4440/m.7299 type:complete len:713 (+) Transcript_4440:181-2319(+)